jgi:hypothetical protein
METSPHLRAQCEFNKQRVSIQHMHQGIRSCTRHTFRDYRDVHDERVTPCLLGLPYEEMGKESSSNTPCSEDKNCGCCEKGHIVGLVKLGATAKVCKRRGNTPECLNQTCCVAKTHSFVTELKSIVQLDKTYPLLQGALVPVMASIPSTILPQTLLGDLVKSSLVVRKRIADKVLGIRPQRPGPDSYDFCGPPGLHQKCVSCDPDHPSSRARGIRH